MADAPTPKICSICGIDVSNKPRTKDPSGRYVCAECIDKAKQTKQVLKNPPKPGTAKPAVRAASDGEGDNSFILDIGASSAGTKGGKACPNCGRGLSQDSVVCIGCGYNANTGKQIQVKVVKAKKDKQK